jgi:hypothetical protein
MHLRQPNIYNTDNSAKSEALEEGIKNVLDNCVGNKIFYNISSFP